MRQNRRIATYLLSAWALTLIGSTAWSQTNVGLMLVPWADAKETVDVRADGFWFFDAEASRTGESLDLAILESKGRFRINPGEIISPRLGYSYTYINLGGETDLLPDRLVDVSVAGGAYMGRKDDWIFAATLGGGYSGNSPFGDGNGWYPKAAIGVGRQIDENSYLGILLDFDGNRTIFPDVPLPGVAYNRTIDKTLQMTVGFPINSIRWTPNDRTTVVAQLLIDQADLYAGYEVIDDFTVFAGWSGRQNAFTLESLGDDRLFFVQRRLEAGVQWAVTEKISLRVAGGWAYNQQFETGWDVRNTDRVTKISDTAFVQGGMVFRF